MCRMAAWMGDPRPLSSLLFDSDRALTTQAWDPHEMLYGHVNVDGTGVAWWPPGDESLPPLRYATVNAPWNDANLPALAGRLQAATMIAAVRSATPGIPFGPTSVAPFVRGPIALSHNGFITDFRRGVGRRLLGLLNDEVFAEFDAVSDSQVVLLLVREHLARPLPLHQAVEAALADIRRCLHDTGAQATLNLLVSDGAELLAVRSSVGLEHNSLYLRPTTEGVWIASEPLDSATAWEPIATEQMAVVRGGEVTLHQLA